MLLLIKILKLIPLKIRTKLFALIGYIFSFIPLKEKKIADLQMQLFLGKDYKKADLNKIYSNIGQAVAETIDAVKVLEDPQAVVSEDLNLLKEIIGRKKPVIALSAHTSNWDLLAAYLIKYATPLTTAGKEAKSPILQRLLIEIRNAYGIKTIWRSNKMSAKELINDLKNGIMVSALIDQDTDVASITSNFFGVPVKTPVGFLNLGKRVDAQFVCIFIFRIGLNRYKVYMHEIDNSLDNTSIANQYHKYLESYIRQYPEQWVWFHKRWRTLPDGKRLSSKEYIQYLSAQLKNAKN